MKPYKGLIDDWSKIQVGPSDDEHLGFYIVGKPDGHPDFPTSSWIRTSMVVRIGGVNNIPTFIETLNSRYDLGKPHHSGELLDNILT